METVVQPPADAELQLLTHWGDPIERLRARQAAVLSVLAHLALIVVLVLLPAVLVERPEPEPERHVTPIFLPLTELTQKAPNKGKVSKEFNAAELEPRPRVPRPPGAPSSAPAPAAGPPASRSGSQAGRRCRASADAPGSSQGGSAKAGSANRGPAGCYASAADSGAGDRPQIAVPESHRSGPAQPQCPLAIRQSRGRGHSPGDPHAGGDCRWGIAAFSARGGGQSPQLPSRDRISGQRCRIAHRRSGRGFPPLPGARPQRGAPALAGDPAGERETSGTPRRRGHPVFHRPDRQSAQAGDSSPAGVRVSIPSTARRSPELAPRCPFLRCPRSSKATDCPAVQVCLQHAQEGRGQWHRARRRTAAGVYNNRRATLKIPYEQHRDYSARRQ